MPYDLLKQQDGDAVVLVETGYGRALGPVLSGPDAEAVMEAFIAGLGVDPAILPPWIIEQRFHEFLTALNQGEEAGEPAGAVETGEPAEAVVPTAAPAPAAIPIRAAAPGFETPGTTPPAPELHAELAASASSGTSPAEPVAEPASPAGDATAGGPEETGETTPDAETGPGEPVRPTVPEGSVTCPQCDGWGTIAKDGQVVQCPLCEGSGFVTPEVADAYRRELAG